MPLEQDIHSFIVRIWYETTDAQEGQPIWRGSIDYVGKNKRLYFQDLNGITRFIQEQAGLDKIRKAGFPWKFRRSPRVSHEKSRD